MTARIKLLIFFISAAIFLFFPKDIFAVAVSSPTNIPLEIQIGQTFSVNSGLSDTQSEEVYFVKCRLGPSSNSSLSDGETYNPITNTWFSDSGSSGKWVDMPMVEVSGTTASFSLQCRVKSGADSGKKALFVRACLKRADGSCGSGSSFQSPPETTFLAIAGPTPTPTRMPTNTPIPTNTPSPKSPTSTPTPGPISYSNIFISEFLADPENGNEMVEIGNSNSFSVSLRDWQIDDIADGGKEPKKFSAEIGQGELHAIDLESTTFLNNSDDDVRLLDSSGSEKDKKSYSSSTKGKSWSKDKNGNWCEVNPSFGEENPGCPSSSTNTPTSVPVTFLPTSTAMLSPTGLILAEATDEGKTPISFLQGLILGEEDGNSIDLISSRKQTTSSGLNKIKGATYFLPRSFLFLGGLSIFAMVGSAFLVQKRRKIL